MNAAQDSTLSAIPAADIAWLVDLIGERAALALVEARGGTRIMVPATENGCRGSILTSIIGLPAVLALARERGGTYFALPLARAWRARIYLARGGMSQAEIALKSGMTENAVQRLAQAGYKPMPRTHRGARDDRGTDTEQPLLPF